MALYHRTIFVVVFNKMWQRVNILIIQLLINLDIAIVKAQQVQAAQQVLVAQ